MRLPSFFRRTPPAEPARPPHRRRVTPLVQGVGGIPVVGGRFPEDDLPELQGDLWPTTAYRMIETDPVIATVWHGMKTTLKSAVWDFAPGSGSAFAKKLSDAARESWGFGDSSGVMSQSFEEALDGALTYLMIGYSYGEVEWGWCEETGRIEVLAPFLHRHQTAHWRWEFCRETGRFDGVSQRYQYGENIPAGTPMHPFIPAENLILLTHDGVGGDLSGTGMLRSVYTPWKHLRDIQIMQMMAAQAHAVGVPQMTTNSKLLEELNLSDSRKEIEQNTVLTQLADYIAGNSAVLLYPDWIDLKLERTAGPEYPWVEVIQQKSFQILRRFLYQSLDLGSAGSGGSRAVATVHDDQLRQSLQNHLQSVAAAYNGRHRPGHPGGVIGRWADLNWPGVMAADIPKLSFSGLDVSPILEVLDKVPGLITAGALVADDTLRGQIRRDLRVAPETVTMEGTTDA